MNDAMIANQEPEGSDAFLEGNIHEFDSVKAVTRQNYDGVDDARKIVSRMFSINEADNHFLFECMESGEVAIIPINKDEPGGRVTQGGHF